ncbi:GlxA family transcriptional regulator [Bermanella sp. WJH001]|uniref:GlxA family transcriptional regulator n=1 Tax=Bermanella sp. WJH001 TaxID=3048005 RepID=UPI0024BDEC80|nr:helix-turn-helix domain-containing protein [Bermanella sp. WJH001]MDJ1536835.1 helix-turn-helix domain-containing protein [Bermanella sp. WJH001]
MKNIYILGFDQALASAITGVLDLFALAGVTWNRIQSTQPTPIFNVQIASANGEPIRCINGINLGAHVSFDEIKQADALIIPTIGGPIEHVLANNPALIELIQTANTKRWILAGNCTGNFLLAHAGILNGKQATTHWGFKDQFKKQYPKVNLTAEFMLTRDEHIYCAGGGLAWFDLGLHMIERFVGFEIAIQTAKAFVIDYRRDSQLSYSLMGLAKPHKDTLIKDVQNWLNLNYAKNISIDELAERFSVSKRTLIRRFNQSLDMPPNAYIQGLRIEGAQKLLEESEMQIETIMNKVGYEDASSFRRLFKSKTGVTPSEYRSRFSRR